MYSKYCKRLPDPVRSAPVMPIPAAICAVTGKLGAGEPALFRRKQAGLLRETLIMPGIRGMSAGTMTGGKARVSA